jgi:protein involved in polysaccharide export with SLBB domain
MNFAPSILNRAHQCRTGAVLSAMALILCVVSLGQNQPQAPNSPDQATTQASHPSIPDDPTVTPDPAQYNSATPPTASETAAPQTAPSDAPGSSSSLRPAEQTSASNPADHLKRKLAKPLEPSDEPTRKQIESPYKDLPSLNDLYTQIPSSGARLRRFGSDVFVLGTGNANQLPLDLPAGPDYVLGPGDNLIVNIWGSRSERLNLLVDRQGQIAVPEAGTIALDGLNITQAQSAIQKALNAQFKDEHVEISLGRLRTVRIYVVGDVQRPGAYDVSSLSTPLAALFAAGGPTSRGSLRVLRHYRGTELVHQIDLYDFLLHGVRSDAERLLPGDTLLVPPVGPQVSVEGMVHRPAIYELLEEHSLDQAIALAGGVVASASLKQISVERVEAHQRRSMLNVQLPETPAAAATQLASFAIQDQDHVVIAQILPYNEQAVYLDGHVFRPGKYPYHEGMTLADLLHSYQDVLPEPADHGELIRLAPPDFRPQTISFNLPDVLIGNDPIALQPFDLVRVFGRYEIDAPLVSIEGEVLRPGDFPMSEGMTAAALLRMAGGFKRSAYRDEADLSSYQVVDGKKVLLTHRVVLVDKALQGDASADVALKPGDVVSIRQLAGWADIGASISVGGEVEHPGVYGIEQGERLSSVLKRAGGFRESAYPPAANLERIQVRELAEKNRQEMIERIESTPLDFKQGLLSAQDQSEMQRALIQQREQILASLRTHSSTGRLVINISSDLRSWEDTPADIELRAGDTLLIPKRPGFISVSGQVNNATALSYLPGKDAAWYLRQAGGVTRTGDRGQTYVVRANGAVVTRGTWAGGRVLALHLKPGDTVVVPEKTPGGSQVWKNVVSLAQIMSSVAITGAVAGIF